MSSIPSIPLSDAAGSPCGVRGLNIQPCLDGGARSGARRPMSRFFDLRWGICSSALTPNRERFQQPQRNPSGSIVDSARAVAAIESASGHTDRPPPG
jgi:hypothetical protein